MKKALCILGAVAIVAFFSTSCNKKCTCKYYEGGKVASTETFDNPDKNIKCKAYTSTRTDENGKQGLECK